MIHLTRLNKHPVVVNSDLIKFVEYTPDTVITLVSGEKIVVTETVEQVLDRITEFRRLLMAWPNDTGPLKVSVPAPVENQENSEG
jgi:flagellar protein FlbD